MTKIEFRSFRHEHDGYYAADLVVDGEVRGEIWAIISPDGTVEDSDHVAWSVTLDLEHAGIDPKGDLADQIREAWAEFCSSYYEEHLSPVVERLADFDHLDASTGVWFPAVADLIHDRYAGEWRVEVYTSDNRYREELGPFSNRDEAIKAFHEAYDEDLEGSRIRRRWLHRQATADEVLASPVGLRAIDH